MNSVLFTKNGKIVKRHTKLPARVNQFDVECFCFVLFLSERFGEFVQISKTLRKIVSIISSFLEDQEARRVLQICFSIYWKKDIFE